MCLHDKDNSRTAEALSTQRVAEEDLCVEFTLRDLAVRGQPDLCGATTLTPLPLAGEGWGEGRPADWL